MNIKTFLKDSVSVSRDKTSDVAIAISNFMKSEKKTLLLVSNSFDKAKLKDLEKTEDYKNSVVTMLDRSYLNISSVYATLKKEVSVEQYKSMLNNNKISSSKIDNYKKSLILIEK